MATYKLKKDTNEAKPWDYGGGHAVLWWSFAGEVGKSGYVQQISPFVYCRETLAARLYDKITFSKFNKIQLDRLRLLTEVKESKTGPLVIYGRHISNEALIKRFESGINAGLQIVRIFERKNKWVKTIVHDVIVPDDSKRHVKLLVASSKWMKSSHMLSLYTLIFRMAQDPYFHKKEFACIKREDTLIKYIESWTKIRTYQEDKSMVKLTFKYWSPLLKNFNKVFRGLPIKRNFNRDGPGGGSSCDGIGSLCDNSICDETIARKFRSIVVPESKEVKVRRASK